MNNVTLVGNLGADVDLRYTGEGTAVANLRVCTSERWTDKRTGEEKENSQWHNVVVWGSEAEALARAAGRGDRLMIAGGALETREYDNRDGEKRVVTEVVVRWPRGQIAIVPRSDTQQGGRSAPAGQSGHPRGPNAGRLDRQGPPPDDFGGYGKQAPRGGRVRDA